MSGGETTIYLGDESSTGETESIYQLQDGGLGGYSDGDSILDPCELPSRAIIGTPPMLKSSTAAAMTSGSTAAATAGASGFTLPPAQVLSELLDALTTLLVAEVTLANEVQHNADVVKPRDEMAKAREDLDPENVRMATEQAALETESHRIREEAFRLNLDQNASNDVLRRRHQSRLPSQFEGRNLFNTPGAGMSNPPGVTGLPRHL